MREDSLGIPNALSRELLLTETKIFQVFDLLAARIDRHLDYPLMLAENGVQGVATLDLYFDDQGLVNEAKSKCFGDRRVLRGLLVKATREALVEWFVNDAKRIRRDQFRNQHFRADFVIVGNEFDSAEQNRGIAGTYNFVRKKHIRNSASCLAPGPNANGVVDFACLGMKLVGAIRGNVDSTYRSRFEALKETMERYDMLELTGINGAVEKAS